MAKEGRKKSPVQRNVALFTFLAVVVYVGLHILARTEGMKQAVIDRLTRWTGEAVFVEQCSLTPLLHLKVDQVELTGVSVESLKIGFNPLAFFRFLGERPLIHRLALEGLDVTLVHREPQGALQPLVLHRMGARLGSVLGVQGIGVVDDDELPTVPREFVSAQTIFELERAKVVWSDGAAGELAYLTDVESSMKVVAFSERSARQTRLKCGHIKLASGQIIRDLELEIVQIEGYEPALILTFSDSAGQYDGFQTKTLWKDLYLRLRKLAEL